MTESEQDFEFFGQHLGPIWARFANFFQTASAGVWTNLRNFEQVQLPIWTNFSMKKFNKCQFKFSILQRHQCLKVQFSPVFWPDFDGPQPQPVAYYGEQTGCNRSVDRVYDSKKHATGNRRSSPNQSGPVRSQSFFCIRKNTKNFLTLLTFQL